MDVSQKLYYQLMLGMHRAYLITRNDHLVAVVTYLIGNDDDKYLHNREPWTIIKDEPWGKTAYIDQLIVKDHDSLPYIHREFSNLIMRLRQEFPQIERVKWIRVGAGFRKHGRKEGVKTYVHCKNLK